VRSFGVNTSKLAGVVGICKSKGHFVNKRLPRQRILKDYLPVCNEWHGNARQVQEISQVSKPTLLADYEGPEHHQGVLVTGFAEGRCRHLFNLEGVRGDNYPAVAPISAQIVPLPHFPRRRQYG
jgi:hypothetical protein